MFVDGPNEIVLHTKLFLSVHSHPDFTIRRANRTPNGAMKQ